MDFWNWFWIWYFELEDSWTYNREFKEFDMKLQWSWFEKMTKGSDEMIAKIRVDYDDSEQWTWTGWNKFWDTYLTRATSAGGPNLRKKPQQGDEDKVCEDGYFLNSANNFCLKCPAGCEACNEVNQCYECSSNFEIVRGPSFSYCYPKCFNSMYRPTYFTRDSDMLANFMLNVFGDIPPAISP
jgi:hypothetical protein